MKSYPLVWGVGGDRSRISGRSPSGWSLRSHIELSNNQQGKLSMSVSVCYLQPATCELASPADKRDELHESERCARNGLFESGKMPPILFCGKMPQPLSAKS